MIVVTAGSAYLDIDSYAGCIAYAELLNLQGHQAVAASTAPLNYSITKDVLRNDIDLNAYKPTPSDEFVLVDISVKEFFDPIAVSDKVVEIIDHHPGHEAYWKERLGEKAQIETIGAACTQVHERWMAANMLESMKPTTAKMLAAGILDNTLNFTASVTKDRDHSAYADLKRIAGLGDDFPAKYFSEVQRAIEADLENAIKTDTKTITETDNVPRTFGQIVAWDGAAIAHRESGRIASVMEKIDDDWGVNVISISEEKSYFVAKNITSQQKFSDLFGVTFTDGVSEPYPSILRKEILRAAIDKAEK